MYTWRGIYNGLGVALIAQGHSMNSMHVNSVWWMICPASHRPHVLGREDFQTLHLSRGPGYQIVVGSLSGPNGRCYLFQSVQGQFEACIIGNHGLALRRPDVSAVRSSVEPWSEFL